MIGVSFYFSSTLKAVGPGQVCRSEPSHQAVAVREGVLARAQEQAVVAVRALRLVLPTARAAIGVCSGVSVRRATNRAADRRVRTRMLVS